MPSSSTSRGTWGDSVSRTKSRRAVSTTTAADAAAAAAAPTKAVPAAADSQRQSQPQPLPRFSQYGARFKSKPKAGSGVAAPTRGPSGLSSRGFFKLGGGGRSTGARGGSSGSSEGATTINEKAREAGKSRRQTHTHGHSHARLERERGREREREPTKSNPAPPPLPQRVKPRSLPLAGPAALAATINSTLTVTTGRAAGETISTFDFSDTNGSGGGGGGGGSAFGVGTGSGSGNGESGAETTSPAYSETWKWANSDTPPPACMPSLHQSSGSEDPSGSEDDEGFGLGFRVDADYEKFIRERRAASTSVLKFRPAMMASAPGGGSLGVQTGSYSSSRPSARGSGGPGPASASAAAAAVERTTTTPAQDQPLPPLPPRVPRSMSVGEPGSGVVQPSNAPPPLPVRRLVAGADAPAAAPARSPPRRRPVSVKGAKAKARAKAEAAAKAKAKGGGQEDGGLRRYFRDPRLETTLGLIRSGQAFCEERHIVVDFVRRAEPTTAGSGKAEVQPMDDPLRHALLLTNAALYLLEVEMLPPSQQQQPSSSVGQTAHQDPSMASTTELGDEAGQVLATANGAAAVGGSGYGSGSSSSGCRSPRHTAGGAAGAAGSEAAEKAKVKSIKLMDRLMPTELAGMSLPFREATLRNGDVVAKRGTGIVLHTRVEGRRGNLWLKCRSNQDRGALVDALVPWFETNSPGKRELDVQQVPEGPLATRLAQFNASVAGDMTRRKDTDCSIS